MSYLSISTEILLIGGKYSQLTIVLVCYITFKSLHSLLQYNTGRKIMSCSVSPTSIFSILALVLYTCLKPESTEVVLCLCSFVPFLYHENRCFLPYFSDSLFLSLLLDIRPGPGQCILLSSRRFPS